MNLTKFCADVQTTLQTMGWPLTIIYTTESSTAVLVTDESAVFDTSAAGDEWTDNELAGPGNPAGVCVCFVGITITVRGIVRTNGAQRNDHVDWTRQLVSQLVVAIERVRKSAGRAWSRRFGQAGFVPVKAGDQPEQGARYVLTLQLGSPVVELEAPTVDGSTLGTTGHVVATGPDGTTANVCSS